MLDLKIIISQKFSSDIIGNYHVARPLADVLFDGKLWSLLKASLMGADLSEKARPPVTEVHWTHGTVSNLTYDRLG